MTPASSRFLNPDGSGRIGPIGIAFGACILTILVTRLFMGTLYPGLAPSPLESAGYLAIAVGSGILGARLVRHPSDH